MTIGEGGYMNNPGYPLYYLGEDTCGWTFRALPGQRIVLTFHDLNIRGKLAPYTSLQNYTPKLFHHDTLKKFYRKHFYINQM